MLTRAVLKDGAAVSGDPVLEGPADVHLGAVKVGGAGRVTPTGTKETRAAEPGRCLVPVAQRVATSSGSGHDVPEKLRPGAGLQHPFCLPLHLPDALAGDAVLGGQGVEGVGVVEAVAPDWDVPVALR